jgi:hypothetical protein
MVLCNHMEPVPVAPKSLLFFLSALTDDPALDDADAADMLCLIERLGQEGMRGQQFPGGDSRCLNAFASSVAMML